MSMYITKREPAFSSIQRLACSDTTQTYRVSSVQAKIPHMPLPTDEESLHLATDTAHAFEPLFGENGGVCVTQTRKVAQQMWSALEEKGPKSRALRNTDEDPESLGAKWAGDFLRRPKPPTECG